MDKKAETVSREKFILYIDEFEMLEELSNDEIGALLRALMEKVKCGTDPKFPIKLSIPFKFIYDHIERDREKYLKISEKRSVAGKKVKKGLIEEDW